MFQVFQFNEANNSTTPWCACDLVVVLLCKSADLSGRFQTHLAPTMDALMLAESWSDSKYMGKRVLKKTDNYFQRHVSACLCHLQFNSE